MDLLQPVRLIYRCNLKAEFWMSGGVWCLFIRVKLCFYPGCVWVLQEKCLESVQHISAHDKERMWRPETCSLMLHIHTDQQRGIQPEAMTSRRMLHPKEALRQLPVCERFAVCVSS